LALESWPQYATLDGPRSGGTQPVLYLGARIARPSSGRRNRQLPNLSLSEKSTTIRDRVGHSIADG
jgi:hypothetical protein